MNILITGANGQMGQTLLKIGKNQASSFNFIGLSKQELDITNKKALVKYISLDKPDIFVNLAAYTNVEKAECETKQAFLVNKTGIGYIAEICKTASIPLIHLSTDYIFNNPTVICAFKEDDLTNPINIYGKSKLEGEELVRSIYDEVIILRSSWIISNKKTNNFFTRICQITSKQDELRVVHDQHGAPTTAESVANVIINFINAIANGFYAWGTYHYCDRPAATWYDLAQTIVDRINIVNKRQIKVTAITTDELQSNVKRPFCSLLNCEKIKNTLGIEQAFWKPLVEQYLL